MNEKNLKQQSDAGQDIVSSTTNYEAPRVESVLTPEDMEREVLYAGNVVSGDGAN